MALTPSQKSKKNYNYGRIGVDSIEYAPYYLVIGKRCYINAKPELYLQEGWKRIVYSELPEDFEEVEYIETLTEDDTTIYSGWVKVSHMS